MAFEIKQSLKLGQHLVMTPQLQQAIKLLQLNRLEMQELINQELVENPCLEELGELDQYEEEPESGDANLPGPSLAMAASTPPCGSAGHRSAPRATPSPCRLVPAATASDKVR